MVISDDITSPTGSVELLRLTLTKLLLSLAPAPTSLPAEFEVDPGVGAASISALMSDTSLIEVYCSSLQVDNQLYNRASFHFPVLLCQDQRGGVEPGGQWSSDANPTESPEALDAFKCSCFLQLRVTLSGDRCAVEEVRIIPASYLHQEMTKMCPIICIELFACFVPSGVPPAPAGQSLPRRHFCLLH